jgi:hypothetical protein
MSLISVENAIADIDLDPQEINGRAAQLSHSGGWPPMNDLTGRPLDGSPDAFESEKASSCDAGLLPLANTGAPISVTWARTLDRLPIGKEYRASGKWPVTSGVKAKAFVFQVVEYPDLPAYGDDYQTRQREGCWAIVAGNPGLDLDPTKPHPRQARNFIDVPRWTLTLDLDGLDPEDENSPIDSPEAFTNAAPAVAIKRLPKAFHGAGGLIFATSSTGLNFNANGEPSEGRARLRLTFHLSRALTNAQQRQIAACLSKRPGLNRPKLIDLSLFDREHFEFVARPIWAKDMPDPVEHPVLQLEGGLVDVDALLKELGVNGATEPPPQPGRGATGKDIKPKPANAADGGLAPAEVGAVAVSPKNGQTGPASGRDPPEWLALSVPEPKRARILAQMIDALPNDEDRTGYIMVAHAVRGSCGGAAYGREFFLNWAGRWTGGTPNPVEDARVYNTLPDTHVGGQRLCNLVEAKGGARGRAALASFYAEIFPDDQPDSPRSEAAAPAGSREARFRQALRYEVAAAPGVRRKRDFDKGPEGFISFGTNYLPEPATVMPWVAPWLMREAVSSKIGAPGGGKTTLMISTAIAIATEKPEIVGLKPGELTRFGDCVVFCNEDPSIKAHNQILAVLHAFGLTRADLKHELHLEESKFTLVRYGSARGGAEPSDDAIRIAGQLAQLRKRAEIAYVGLDTLLSLAGSVGLNGPEGMTPILNMARDIAETLGCAVELLHHFSKSGGSDAPTDMMSALGSVALPAAVRVATHVVPISETDGSRYGWTPAQTALRVKMVDAKQSYRARSIAAGRFYEWRNVHLPAHDPENPAAFLSEDVGVLVPIDPPSANRVSVNDALQAISAALAQGIKVRRGGLKGRQTVTDAHSVLENEFGIGRRDAEDLIRQLIQAGDLKTEPQWFGRNQVAILVEAI